MGISNMYGDIFLIIKHLCFFFSFLLMLLPDITNKVLADYHLYIYGLLLVIEVMQVKAISLYSIWIAGFVYMILSEMILFPGGSEYNITVRYVLLANNLVLLGYSIGRNKKFFQYKQTRLSTNSQLFPFLLLFLTIFYIYNTYTSVVASYAYGRQLVSTTGSGTLLGTLNSSVGIILPSLIAYYVVHIRKSSKWIALLLVLPFFLFIFILATRFKLLFSVLPFFLISGFLNFNKITLKSTLYLILIIIVLVLSSLFTRTNRNESYSIGFGSLLELFELEDSKSSFAERIAQNCSPEGCVEMTHLSERYFENHDYTYGKSIGFISYFWIPRAVWPDKPTQIDHWLPRYYNPQMPDTASTASGFTGELRADFGYFSLFLLFLLGIFLKRCNYYLIYYNYGRAACYESIYASLLIPTTFFALRGLNLAITTFLCSFAVLKLLSIIKGKSNE